MEQNVETQYGVAWPDGEVTVYPSRHYAESISDRYASMGTKLAAREVQTIYSDWTVDSNLAVA